MNSIRDATPNVEANAIDCASKPARTALVLQGGGALGAYQAGVYQALHEHGLTPDWVVGTSIGAINAALIAGNKPQDRVQRLHEFWDSISRQDVVDMNWVADPLRQANTWLGTVSTVLQGARNFFTPRPLNMFAVGLPVKPDDASFYDTYPLAKTLSALVDFDYLHSPVGIRLTVNAVKVVTGQLTCFDSRKQPIGIEHIMGSGALPPGFAPVRIDGDLYWDGGLYSNTPLETVLDDEPISNTLCFMVDLWNPVGPEPTTMDEVATRQKDIMYASRSTGHIDNYLQQHRLQRMVRHYYDKLPAAMKTSEDSKMLAALGCNTTIHIVRIPYGGQDWGMAAKDINFSKGSLEWRWQQGYQDGSRAAVQAAWLQKVDDDLGVVVHDLQPA